MTTDIPAVSVQFDITLDTVVGFDGRADKPITFLDAIIGALADKVYAENRDDISEHINYRAIVKDIDAEINRIIGEKLKDVVTREVIPTDNYGNRTGEPTTLAARIEDAGKKWLGERRDDGYHSSSATNFGYIVKEQIGHAFTAELKKAIDAAKADATKVIQEQAAQVFAETITRAAGVI